MSWKALKIKVKSSQRDRDYCIAGCLITFQNNSEPLRTLSREVFLIVGFSLLSIEEFLSTEKWIYAQHKTTRYAGAATIVIQKNHLSVIIELFRLLS
jgi:hypothetical protein